MSKRLVAGLFSIAVGCSSNEQNGYGEPSSGVASTGAGTGASTTGENMPPSTVGDVIFSVPSGTFTTTFTTSLSSSVPGLEIRYTLDGTRATANSLLYTGQPLTISESTEIHANVFQHGVAMGNPGYVVYSARSVDAVSSLPLILIDTYGAGEPGEGDFELSSFMVFDNAPSAQLSQAPSVAARAGIRVRGQSSADFEKKNYRIELWDDMGMDADFPLLGMPAQSDWVLHGPFVDKSLIRNAFVYSLGAEMGLAAPRFAFAELYLNTSDRPMEESDYRGVYLLVETIKNSSNRLNLAKLGPTDTTLPDISGGYIFKFELDVAEPPLLTCAGGGRGGSPCWQDLEVYDPIPLAAEQQSWLNQHIQAFHDSLFSDSFADPSLGYAGYIEVPSFVNYVVLTEVTRDLDSYIRSFYFHKDRDSRIVTGPLWDYNLAMGTGCCDSNLSTEGWQHEVTRNAEANGWFQRLLEDPAFGAMVSGRYRELRASLLSDTQIDARIDALSGPLAQAAEKNFERWPNLTESRFTFFDTPTDGTYMGQLDSMRNWLKQRLSWLDTQW